MIDRQDLRSRPLRRLTKTAALALTIALAAPPRVVAFDAGPPDDRPGSIVALLAKVIPTVVAIHTRRNISADAADPSKASFSPKIQRAEGSGFIATADGFIATNKHVVHGAYAVTVSLHDGRTTAAKIVWESMVVDVAFLKIEPDPAHPLQPAKLARDNMLQIGRRVVAIGNPLGLGISASAGIVSAIDRNLSQTPYDSYVQTDAAINSGNSGGPLFDLDGEVVGMNSILWTVGMDQGSQGLGFAIPGPDISFLIEKLMRDGRIECGTLGLHGQKMTPGMADALGFKGHYGVIVATIEKDSAAEEAGLRLGDIIESFDGKVLDDITTLNRATCMALGHPASMKVWRDGHDMSLEARVKEADDAKLGSTGEGKLDAPRFANARDLGMGLAPVDAATRRRYKLGKDTQGFVVTSIADSSEAAIAGLSVGDVLTSLQMRPLSGSKSFDAMFADYGRMGHGHVIILVKASGGERWVTLPVRLEGAL